MRNRQEQFYSLLCMIYRITFKIDKTDNDRKTWASQEERESTQGGSWETSSKSYHARRRMIITSCHSSLSRAHCSHLILTPQRKNQRRNLVSKKMKHKIEAWKRLIIDFVPFLQENKTRKRKHTNQYMASNCFSFYQREHDWQNHDATQTKSKTHKRMINYRRAFSSERILSSICHFSAKRFSAVIDTAPFCVFTFKISNEWMNESMNQTASKTTQRLPLQK